jgi:hypothetical protein
VAAIFSSRYKAYHEPEARELTDLFLKTRNNPQSDQALSRYFRKRDRRLWLELESSHFDYLFIDVLVREFPKARFILTIRDWYSWLDSVINHQLSGPWGKLEEIRFEPQKFRYAPEEEALKMRGLYPLDSYLTYWVSHNQKILSAVPPNRLLVIQTNQIERKIQALADFLAIPAKTLDPKKSHSYAAKRKFDVLTRMDKGYLESKAGQCCQPLMNMYFPGYSLPAK